MRFTAVFDCGIQETFSCSSFAWARWYAQARAKRFGWELVRIEPV